MFKSFGLTTRIGFSFVLMTVVSVIIGIVARYGTDKVSAAQEANRLGGHIKQDLVTGGIARRDFSIRGFEKGPNGQSADKVWWGIHRKIESNLKKLHAIPALHEDDRVFVATATKHLAEHKAAFEAMVAARQARDAAFKEWSRVGWALTEATSELVNDQILPKLESAVAGENMAAATRISAIRASLNEEVLERFLLLRVTAVYLIATNADAQWEGYQKQLATTKEGIANFAQEVSGDGDLESLAVELAGFIQEYEAAGDQYYAGILGGRAADKTMSTVASHILTSVSDLQDNLEKEMVAQIGQIKMITVYMVAAGVLVGVFLTWRLTRTISTTVTGPVRRIIDSLSEGAEQVSLASNQIARTSESLAQGTTEQASSLEETSAALTELSAMTQTNAENAKSADEVSRQARNAAESGTTIIHDLNEAMTAINESSGQISRIIKVIEEIAFQTNLLALNAAVEAARAGEHGKGFAVVAEEVRSLAQRAATAAGETTALIASSVSKAREGADVSTKVSGSLDAIATDVSKVADIISGIAHASAEQAEGVAQISSAVSQMDKVTQSNAATAEESAAASSELRNQAETSTKMVQELRGVVGGSVAK